MWVAGAPVGIRLPLVAPRLRSPAQFLDGIAGAARRSLAVRLFVGDLDLGAYSSNWDLQHLALPSRACAYCATRWQTFPFVEDEWHVLLICPLYESFRHLLPFRAEEILVEGHRMQGGGCSAHNLRSLARALLQVTDPNRVAEFLGRAMSARRKFRNKLR